MKRFCIGLAGLLLLTLPAAADGRDEEGARGRCVADAYSFAEVVPPDREAHPRGPIVVGPDMLCADLGGSQTTRIDSLNLYVGGGSGQPDMGPSGSPYPHFRRH